MDDQAYGFAAADCRDISKVVRMFRGSQLTPNGAGSATRNLTPGQLQSYVLLQNLGPSNASAGVGGDFFEAQALRLVPTNNFVQVIQSTVKSGFTLTRSGSDTSVLDGTASGMETALNGLGASCVVLGRGSTINNENGSTSTIAANVWFVTFADGDSVPPMITSKYPHVTTSWLSCSPLDIPETVYTAHPVTVAEMIPAGHIVEGTAQPGVGVVVGCRYEGTVEGYATTHIEAAATLWGTASSRGKVRLKLPDPDSTTSGSASSATEPGWIDAGEVSVRNIDITLDIPINTYVRVKRFRVNAGWEWRVVWAAC